MGTVGIGRCGHQRRMSTEYRSFYNRLILSGKSMKVCIFLAFCCIICCAQVKGNDCQWSSWSNTGQCSEQCRGDVIKSRTVLVPAKNGGSCVGNTYENEPCNENPFGPMGAYFEFLGNGWCRSSGNQKVNGYMKDHSNQNECKLKCLNEPSCTGYSISDSKYNYPNRCYVHGCLRPESFNGWKEWVFGNFLPSQALTPNRKSLKCYKRNK